MKSVAAKARSSFAKVRGTSSVRTSAPAAAVYNGSCVFVVCCRVCACSGQDRAYRRAGQSKPRVRIQVDETKLARAHELASSIRSGNTVRRCGCLPNLASRSHTMPFSEQWRGATHRRVPLRAMGTTGTVFSPILCDDRVASGRQYHTTATNTAKPGSSRSVMK